MYSMKASLLDFSGIFESNSGFSKAKSFLFLFVGKFMDRVTGALDEKR